jgi:hypothetical protein
MDQRNQLRRERALWAVKLSIPSLAKEDSLSVNIQFGEDDEIDLSYQQDEIVFDEGSPPSDLEDTAPTAAARASLYVEAENCLQMVLAADTNSNLSSPSSSPKTLSSTSWPDDGPPGQEEKEAAEEETAPYDPPSELTAGRMKKYLSGTLTESPGQLPPPPATTTTMTTMPTLPL